MRAVRALILCLSMFLAAPALAAGEGFPKSLDTAIAEAKASMMESPSEVIDHVARAEQIAKQLADPRRRALALATTRWLAAEAYLRTNQAEKAGPLLEEGLKLIEPIPEPLKVRGDLLMSRGAYFMREEHAADALSAFQDAFRIFGSVKEPRSQAIALANIGALYSSAHDDGRAERYYRQAAEIYDADPWVSLSLHNNRGNVLMLLERYAEAEKEFLTAQKIARQLEKPLLEANVLNNIARNQVEARKFDEAARTLKRGFQLTGNDTASPWRRQLLATAARLAEDRGDLREAGKLIRQTFAGLDPANTSVEFRTPHLYAYRIFRALGQTSLALEHLEALKRLSDEAAKVATTNSAALMAAQFDYANQQTRIETLRRQEVERTARFQRTLFLSIGAATLLVIAALAFGLVSLRRSRNKVRAANIVLGETNVALEKALKAKTEFLATTSHEIRTPLNGILGMTQVMLSDPKLDPPTRDRIGIVHGAGMTMRSLVDDILDVAKMETGNLTVEALPMNLPATLQEVTRIWEEQARAKGLTFELDVAAAPGWIVSDAGRLRQIVFNLLSNALKFTEAGRIGVRAAALGEGDARRLHIAILDSGVGIPPEKAEEIFESFKQADSGTTRKFGGTGLGLTICRNLARALGGDVSVTSREGEGSTFTVDLPLVLAEAPVEEQPERAGGGLLVLDRNPIARSMLKTLLEPHFGMPKFVATPDEALAAIDQGAAMLLIDEATLKAAGDDPIATLSPLTAASQQNGVATAILWLKPEQSVCEALKHAGIDQVVEKPVSGADLVAALDSLGDENSKNARAGPLVSRAA